MMPELAHDAELPRWPPDCFALCLSLLKATGGYAELFTKWPGDAANGLVLNDWVSDTRALGARWREAYSAGREFNELDDSWRLILDDFNEVLPLIKRKPPLLKALMRIVAAADEAFAGVGAVISEPVSVDNFLVEARTRLAEGNLSTIHWTRLTVLPRMHTLQKGLSDGSLSLNLALYDSPEVQVSWINGSTCAPKDSVNLLFVPWPFEVAVRQFSECTPVDAQLPDDFRYFSYEPAASLNVDLLALRSKAEEQVGRIDGIVMPEMALTESEYNALVPKVKSPHFLIAGVLGKSIPHQCPANWARASFGGQAVQQTKHHPWTIDETQLLQYGLGAALSPTKTWREYGDFTARSLSFVALRADLVLNVLVCEDLARPDPVANLVRSVAPNLVVALLMDGPQIKERWSARYATILAEDPGCSVLAITSRGMSNLSRPKPGTVNKSQFLAIWRDAFNGPTELELPESAQALALSLSMKTRKKYTADGRERVVQCLILSGAHPISLPVPA